MSYRVHDEASKASSALDGIKIDLSSFEDVITLDDKPLNLGPVIDKIKNIVTETTSELNSTENIED